MENITSSAKGWSIVAYGFSNLHKIQIGVGGLFWKMSAVQIIKIQYAANNPGVFKNIHTLLHCQDFLLRLYPHFAYALMENNTAQQRSD